MKHIRKIYKLLPCVFSDGTHTWRNVFRKILFKWSQRLA